MRDTIRRLLGLGTRRERVSRAPALLARIRFQNRRLRSFFTAVLNLRSVFQIIGLLLMLVALFMPVGVVWSIYYGDDDAAALLSAAGITFVSGLCVWLLTRAMARGAGPELRKREGYLIVSLSWVFISAFSALPFVFHGSIPSYTDAFFETMSGYTTTGASILNDIEQLPHGLLFWRSMTHFLGGMGIIVLSLAILPLLGVGGMRLFEAEMAGPSKDKIHPQIQGTAKRLWSIYVAFTGLQTILLLFGGMPLFDALCHSFGTMATGGFSTKNASVAYYDSPYIQYVIVVFMFLAGTNFTLHYHAMKGRVGRYFQDEEFRFYFISVSAVILLMTIIVYGNGTNGLERSFRDAAFQVVSIISSTGFITSDYETWAGPGRHYTQVCFFIMLFFGASAGSTTGGIKMVRLLLLAKNGLLELRRLHHPRAVLPVRFNERAVPPQVIGNILAFVVLYMITFMVGSLIMSYIGLDFLTAMGSVAATLGCIGPGIAGVGPMKNFAQVPDIGKWVLAFLMLLGRLEIFTILMIFTPRFWKT